MKLQWLAIALLVLVALPATAEEGTVTLTFSNIIGLTETGQPDPTVTPACWKKYHGFLGQKDVVQYQINPHTGIMISYATVFGAKVTMHPLGIAGIYAFMSDGVPSKLKSKGIFQVGFQLSTSFEDPRGYVLAELDKTHNCLINNSYR